MKQTLTAAHLRSQAADFVVLHRYELVLLRQLSLLAREVYHELVNLSDFKTGHIYRKGDPRVSYAVLVALLTPDQPLQGRRIPAPTIKQIRDALDDLEDVGLLGRNRRANEGVGALFLEVMSRQEAASRTANKGREEGRGQIAREPSKNRHSGPSIHKQRAGFRAGVSEGHSVSIPPPQNELDLSTGQPRPPEPKTPPGPIQIGAVLGEKIGPPRGAERDAPRGVTATAAAMKQRMRSAKTEEIQSIRSGERESLDAPPTTEGGAEAITAPSARLRRPGQGKASPAQ